MSKYLAIGLVIVLSMCVLSGCIFKSDDKSKGTVTDNSTNVEQKGVYYSPYYEMINKARNAIVNGLEQGEVASDDLSTSFYSNDEGKKQFGYVFRDLDNDGINEMIFGVNTDKPDDKNLWNNSILDVYTIKDGQLVHVLDGWERNIIRLRNDGIFVNRGSGGAGSYGYRFYTYGDAKLNLVELLTYDMGHWYYANQDIVPVYKSNGEDDLSGFTEYTAEQAKAMIDNYSRDFVNITYTPFLE